MKIHLKAERWLAESLGLEVGGTPFPWQSRLLNELISGRLPGALDLPTGLGKTSVMAIWLVARALGASVPRRMVYVVDRRAVVDQATGVAEHLRAWVAGEAEVQKALGLMDTLPISTLRGQHVDNKAWLADPSMPAIVLGTVDMVGSRLLFSGYGVSSKMRPYHAGLLGVDALVVLDEAHLVRPFELLIGQIATGNDCNGQLLRADAESRANTVPQLRVLSLSATGQHPVVGRTFGLDALDRAHPVVQERLGAAKRLTLCQEVSLKDLPNTLAKNAWKISAEGTKPVRIIVFVNSREHAKTVKLLLDKLRGTVGQTELFVGGRRGFEREEAARRLHSLGYIAGRGVPAEQPIFLIATSAGEVGVDLDAEHAVCDLVAWERMVQRLGRVNRRGWGEATVLVVPAIRDDAITPQQVAAIELLQALPRYRDGSIDASPAALQGLRTQDGSQEVIERASTPAPLHPPLSRALVDAWSMTSLEDHSGRPEVEPWLRGWADEEETPQTTVVWRTHLPVTEDGDGQLFTPIDLELFWDAAGPLLSEQLQTEMPQVRDWLIKRAQAVSSPGVSADGRYPFRGRDALAIVMRNSPTDCHLLRAEDVLNAFKGDLERLLSGATLMVDARLGGLASGLLSTDTSEPALDVTEAGTDELPSPVPFKVTRADSEGLLLPLKGWRTEASLALQRDDGDVSVWLVVRSRVEQMAGSEEGRSGAQRLQLLGEHQKWTEETARRIAQGLDLPAEYTEMLAVAARLHDEGKRAARWQRAFHAPDQGQPPYAKTIGRPDVALLDGYRHEFGSLPYAEAHERVNALAPELRKLCLHLIAAHHGSARPLIRIQGAAEPPSRAAQRAREIALRYAELSAAWGPWGLAWWEALLRAADQQASRRNDEEGDTNG